MIRLYNAKIWTPGGLLFGELHTSGRYICHIGQSAVRGTEALTADYDAEIDCGGGLLLPLRGADRITAYGSAKLLLSEAVSAGFTGFPDGLKPAQAADLVLIDLSADSLRPDDEIFNDGTWVIASVFRLYQENLIRRVLHNASQKDISFIMLAGEIFLHNKHEGETVKTGLNGASSYREERPF